MKSNTKWALGVSLFVLIGFPIFFLLISLATGQWNFLIFSLPPTFVAGITGLTLVLRQMEKERKSA